MRGVSGFYWVFRSLPQVEISANCKLECQICCLLVFFLCLSDMLGSHHAEPQCGLVQLNIGAGLGPAGVAVSSHSCCIQSVFTEK